MADFMLRYRGSLSSNGDSRQKARIRRVISPQLRELCRHDSRFSNAAQETVNRGTMKGSQFIPGPIGENLFCLVSLGGYDFVAIVNRLHKLIAELDIIFLRRGARGDVIRHGGDLDNRLKTLFDALRLPQMDSELGELPAPQPGERIFCLLEDDALITKVSVDTYQLLEPPPESGNDSEVDLLIRVTVKGSSPTYANLAF